MRLCQDHGWGRDNLDGQELRLLRSRSIFSLVLPAANHNDQEQQSGDLLPHGWLWYRHWLESQLERIDTRWEGSHVKQQQNLPSIWFEFKLWYLHCNIILSPIKLVNDDYENSSLWSMMIVMMIMLTPKLLLLLQLVTIYSVQFVKQTPHIFWWKEHPKHLPSSAG